MMVGESNNTEKYKLIDIRNVYAFFCTLFLRFIVMLFPQKIHISYSLLILFWIFVVTIYPYLWIFDGGDCTFFVSMPFIFFKIPSFCCCCCFIEGAKKDRKRRTFFFADGVEGHHVIYMNKNKKVFW